MDQHKIIRSVCLFTDNPSLKAIARLGELTSGLSGRGFTIQTQRLCSPESDGIFQLDKEGDGSVRLSIGRLNFERATSILDPFCNAKNNIDFNVDLTHELITVTHISLSPISFIGMQVKHLVSLTRSIMHFPARFSLLQAMKRTALLSDYNRPISRKAAKRLKNGLREQRKY